MNQSQKEQIDKAIFQLGSKISNALDLIQQIQELSVLSEAQLVTVGENLEELCLLMEE